MPAPTNLIARLVYAVLAGVVTYVVLYIIGLLVGKFDASIGDIIVKFAPLIGLLVALYYFFAGWRVFPHTSA